MTVKAERRCSRCRRDFDGPLRRGLCAPCYMGQRDRQTAYGRWVADRVDAEPARKHVRELAAAGMGLRHIGAAARVSRSNLQMLLHGCGDKPPRRYLTKAVAERLLAVELQLAPAALMPAVGAQRRLRALVAAGWPQAHLGAELRMRPKTLAALVHNDEPVITVRRHGDIAALFRRLELRPGPSNRARIYGARRGWALPMQWNEDKIDNPKARKPRRPAAVA